jgi:hypothetical protein
MDFAKHEYFFSAVRLSRYLAACGNDQTKAIKLYKANIQLSQALYPIISILEVALRNGIDRQMHLHLADVNWLLTKRNDFANHPQLTYKDKFGVHPDHFFTDKLKQAEDKLRFRKAPILHGKLLAELTFGFWVKFFDISPIKILKGAPLKAFKNSPHMPVTQVHSHLNAIVALRNRISHSEPICFDKSGNLCLATIQSYEANILTALNWLDSDLKAWSEKVNFCKPAINRISSI